MPKCNILIAPNAFKGSMPASGVADKIAEGLNKSFPHARIKKLPVGDGGDGTGVLITNYQHGDVIHAKVHDPIGRIIDASYGIVDNGETAVIEMAAASGVSLLKENELNPLVANSYGTGELMVDALDRGVKKILLTIGGSATVDGGTGILRALGMNFLDENDEKINDLPRDLSKISMIDRRELNPRIAHCQVHVLCDVTNPLLGDQGTAPIFAPQKGADATTIKVLDEGLHHWAKVVYHTAKKEIADIPYGGAAGGVAAGLYGLADAVLVNGLDYFLSLINFEKELEECDIVITGEGTIDEQTLRGKGPFGVAKMSKKHNKIIIGIGGSIHSGINSALWDYFDVLIPVNFHLQSVEDAIASTADNLKLCGYNLGRMINGLWNKK